MNPPRLAERLLRLLLDDRDRDTISGDLLEEYREVAVPTRGASGARWWYRRQVAGLAWRAMRLPAMIGLAIGTALGVMNLIDTARHPLADDDGGTMLAWAVGLIVLWSAATLAVTWRTRRVTDAITAGAVLGIATLMVFHAAAIVRANVFLESIRDRADWQHLLVRYHQSGWTSLRAYVSYEYVTGIPLVVALGTLAGSISGAIGGLVNAVRRINT